MTDRKPHWLDDKRLYSPMPRVCTPARPNMDTPAVPRPFPERGFYEPAPEPAVEAGFYVLPQSLPLKDFYDDLFEEDPDKWVWMFSRLNPNLDPVVKAGTLLVLSDPNNKFCTAQEAQLMQAAEQVKKALEPLTPEEADFMYRYGAEIVTFTGQASTWLGITAVVLEKHLTDLRKTLQDIESLHQNSYRQHGHLKSAEFFAERKTLLTRLDAHLLNSKSLRDRTSFGGHQKLKSALGISSRSLVHHWDKAGAPGQIPGYTQHVDSMSRAMKYMQRGGYIAIAVGGISSLLAIREVCNTGSAEACEKIKFTQGGSFIGSTTFGFISGSLSSSAASSVCASLSITPIGRVVCLAVGVGTGAWAGATGGGMAGEWTGEKIYEVTLP